MRHKLHGTNWLDFRAMGEPEHHVEHEGWLCDALWVPGIVGYPSVMLIVKVDLLSGLTTLMIDEELD